MNLERFVDQVAEHLLPQTFDLVGWDLTASAIKGIDKGYVVGVVQQDPAGMGAAAVEAVFKASKGETVEKKISVPITIVTKANVDPYRSVFK